MLKLDCLGTITDEAIANINKMYESDRCIEIPINFSDLCDERKNKIQTDFTKKHPETYTTVKILSTFICVDINISDKTLTPSLTVAYSAKDNPFDDVMEWDIHFTANEWETFLKEIILLFIAGFKMEVTDYD